MTTWPRREHPIVSGVPLAATLRAVAAAAAAWGAQWQPSGDGGTLWLPVVAGLRRGVLRLRVEAAPGDSPATLLLVVEDGALELHGAALGILLFALVGGLAAVLWPFAPVLLPLVPAGLVLAVAGWLLVVSRLRSSGPEEFAAAVVAAAATGEHDEP